VARDRTTRARRVVDRHLLPGELVEAAVYGAFRDPLRRLSPLQRLEGFFGVLLGKAGVLVLTDRRLLVLPARARERPGDRWLTAQLNRRGVLATAVEELGGLLEVTLTTGVGARRLLFRRREVALGKDLARRLGGRP